ncbi:uncharacterized protein LOC143049857 [Mytilus galloprovincialis]|uniref:uncharacterized protein LOC143049857 n=1 Tax=Mytilus galloprovincialis TaxID=29158 RepID=UPI003F7C57E8
METDVDDNINNSNMKDTTSNHTDSQEIQTTFSEETDNTLHLSLRHQNELTTADGNPITQIRVPEDSGIHSQYPAYNITDSFSRQQYERQRTIPKEKNRDFPGGFKISKSVNPSTEKRELDKNRKAAQGNSSGNTYVTHQQVSKQEKIINVNDAVLVNLKDKQIDKTVLKLVCACLNIKDNQKRTLILRNKHCKTVESKDLDDWYDKVEKKMKEFFFNNIADYVELKGDCNSEVLELSVTPATDLCTLDMYLYFPSVSAADPAKYTKAVEILRQEGPTGPLPTIQNRTYKLNHVVEGLRNENIDTQFKQITGDKVPNTIANMCSHYISAFGNHKGGVVYYGIEDKKGIVIGIDLSNCTHDEIETALEIKIGGMICGKSITKLTRKRHWDIQYFDIEEDGEGNAIMPNRKVIAVKVCRLPGGVFTAVPESYYVDDDGYVKQFDDFEQWRSKMISSYKDTPATKGDAHQLRENLHNICDEIKDLKLSSIHRQPISDNSTVNDSIVVGRTVVGEMCSNIEEWHLVENYIYTERYYQKLKKCMETKRCVILKGLIGTGKSELALQYCYNVRKYNPNIIVYKLRCTDTNMFEKSLRELCKCLPNINIIEKEDTQKETLNKLEDAIIREIRDRDGYQFLLLDDVKPNSKRATNGFLKKCMRVENIKLIVTTSVSLELDAFTEVVEVDGFSEDEAVEFIANISSIQNEDKKYYLELAKKFSYNLKGLHIATSYMKEQHLSAKALTEKLTFPLDMLNFEKTNAVIETIDETLFSSLVSIIRDMHKKYKQDGKEHIFEMILLLQYLEVEKIPIVLFTKTSDVASNFCIDEFIYEIKNSSFGTIYGHDDNRQINTHDLVKSALEIYMTDMESFQITHEQLLRKLLRAFFLLMDKDNKQKSDLQRHTLLVPHARAVLEKLKAEMKDKLEVEPGYVLQLIYLKDIIGYTYSFNEMFSEASEYFEDAKNNLFELLNVEKSFILDFEKLMVAKWDIVCKHSCLTEKTRQLYSVIDEFIKKANHLPSVKHLSEDYVINRYRNAEDVEVLSRLLEKQKLAETTHLVKDEYVQLSRRGYAVPLEWLNTEFLFELVISVLHTYGRRLLYFSDNRDIKTAKIFFSYLAVANDLSKMFIKENQLQNFGSDNGKSNTDRLSSVLTERSVIQSVLHWFCKEREIDTGGTSTLNNCISICKSRLIEVVNYFEFGVFKVLHDESDHFTATIWVRLILRCYRNLIKIEKTDKVRNEALKWGEDLSVKMKSMENNTCYPSLVCVLGDLYYVTDQILKSEKCFEEILPKYAKVEDISQTSEISLKWYEREACVSFIRCRINRSSDQEQHFDADTLKRLEAYKLLLQRNEIKLKCLEEMEVQLKGRLQGVCSESS